MENGEEDEDPGEVRQPHHVSSLNSFPERAPGVVWQPRHVTSHSSFPGPAYLQLDFVRMAFISVSEAVVHARVDHVAVDEMLVQRRRSAVGGEPRHLRGSPWSKTPSRDTLPLGRHWRRRSHRGPVHEKSADVLMSSQVNCR